MRITSRSLATLVAMIVVLLTSTVTHGGGWCSVTVSNMPEYFVAGQPVALTFVVRAHGVTPVDGMKTAVKARMGSQKEIDFASGPTGKTGEYKAVVTLPAPGDWIIRIDSGYMGIPFDLVPTKAIAPGATPPPPISEIERGERLFVLAGCIGCHENAEVRSINIAKIGPTLTGKRYPTDMLKAFLADPSKTWDRSRDSNMPNLRLNPSDIDSIVAFLNRPRT